MSAATVGHDSAARHDTESCDHGVNGSTHADLDNDDVNTKMHVNAPDHECMSPGLEGRCAERECMGADFERRSAESDNSDHSSSPLLGGMGSLLSSPHSRHAEGSCEHKHREHRIKHHFTDSRVVDSSLEGLANHMSPEAHNPPMAFTSTPRDRAASSSSQCSVQSLCSSSMCDRSRSNTIALPLGDSVSVPIVGHEVMEQREKFTVFKIHVVKNQFESWFIFRRYTDFVRLNEKLKILFPYFRLALPPKRWFCDNFEPEFLEDRKLGLQAFIDNITGHRDILNSKAVINFFCFEDPPGPHDSLEESRAMCERLEEAMYSLRQELQEKDTTIELLKEELSVQAAEIDHLNKSLRVERSIVHRGVSPFPLRDTSSLFEVKQTAPPVDHGHDYVHVTVDDGETPADGTGSGVAQSEDLSGENES